MIVNKKIGGTFDNVKKAAQKVIPDVDDVKDKAQQAGALVRDTIDDVKSRAVGTMDALDEMLHALDEELEGAIEEYNRAYTSVNDNGVLLYIQRIRAVDLINNIEQFINSIANHPKSFDKDLVETNVHRDNFLSVSDFAKEELKAAEKSAMTSGAGIAAGAGVACLAPTAAMWIATTFGAASTGTAISTLSGAAATNAALAWLGGGTLAAGGGGVSGGSALLALAGPVGWGIAGATLLTAIVLFTSQNNKINKKKNEEALAVKRNTEALREVDARLQAFLYETLSLREELAKQYHECLPTFGRSFLDLSNEQQIQLGTLVNNTKSISALLEKTL